MILPNPWMIIGAIVMAMSVYFFGHHKGWAERDAEMQAEIAIKNEEARTKEQELTKQLTDNSTKLLEANNAITEKQSSLNRLIRTSSLRIQTPGCVQTSASTTPASGSSSQAGSESDRETLLAIAEIVAQGDRNTAQLNACIDNYNKVMEAVNAKR
jgi:lipopolysaccharide export LptBFGC system permease protein LptF